MIHAAATEALAAGATPHGVLRTCERMAERVPVVLMVYANVVLTAGLEGIRYPRRLGGRRRLIVPDLPHDEAGELQAACDAEGLALVPLVAPTRRIAAIGGDARGFARTISLTGTTGERDRLAAGLEETVGRVRASTARYVAVGFGISTAAQAAAVAELADGVIVGSRVVRATGDGGGEAVGRLVGELAGALAG